MFTISNNLILDIKTATEQGTINWINVDGYLCSEAVFLDAKYMICKYPLEDGNFDVSFNKLNEYNNMLRPYREFSQGDSFYEQLIELADIVWSKKRVVVA